MLASNNSFAAIKVQHKINFFLSLKVNAYEIVGSSTSTSTHATAYFIHPRIVLQCSCLCRSQGRTNYLAIDGQRSGHGWLFGSSTIMMVMLLSFCASPSCFQHFHLTAPYHVIKRISLFFSEEVMSWTSS